MLSGLEIREQAFLAQASCKNLPIFTQCNATASVNRLNDSPWLECRLDRLIQRHPFAPGCIDALPQASRNVVSNFLSALGKHFVPVDSQDFSRGVVLQYLNLEGIQLVSQLLYAASANFVKEN